MAERSPSNNASMARVGGICSILGGALFLASGAGFFLYQVGPFDWNSVLSIGQYFRQNPAASTAWTLINAGAAIASLLAISGVLALSDEVRPAGEGLVRWTSTLAVIGYAIIAVTNLADLFQIRRLALGVVALDPSAQSAVEVIGSGSLDPALSLRFLMIGPWFLAAGGLALQRDLLPKGLAALGVLAGIAALVFVCLSFLDLQTLTLITGAMAVAFHPVWLIWTGIVLGREKPSPS